MLSPSSARGTLLFDLNGKLKWQKIWVYGRPAGHVKAVPRYLWRFLDRIGITRRSCRSLRQRTGKERWKVARDDKTSWSTPLVVEHEGKAQVVISATKRVRGYDLATGRLIWECAGLSRNVVSSPVAGHGMVFAANSYDWQAMLAIRLDGAKGDITDTDRVAWKLNRMTPYVSSPLLYDGILYFLRHNQNILSRLEATTGRPRGEPIRIEGIREIFASPVGAAGRIYITGRDGVTVVLRHDADTNRSRASFLTTFLALAASWTRTLPSGERFLYCRAES